MYALQSPQIVWRPAETESMCSLAECLFLGRFRGFPELGKSMVHKEFQEGKWERSEVFPGGAVCKTGWGGVWGTRNKVT